MGAAYSPGAWANQSVVVWGVVVVGDLSGGANGMIRFSFNWFNFCLFGTGKPQHNINGRIIRNTRLVHHCHITLALKIYVYEMQEIRLATTCKII